MSEIGGAQKVVYDVISSLDKDNYDITLITCPNGELIDWINKLNYTRNFKIKVITLDNIVRKISPLKDLKVLLRLFSIIRKERFDVTHFHSSKMGIIGRISAWLANCPNILFTVHSWGINEYQNPIKRILFGFLEKFTYSISDKVICVSKFVQDKGIYNNWIDNRKSLVIHNGIDDCSSTESNIRIKLKVPDDTCLVCTIMRLREPKMPMFTIKVVSELANRGYNVKLLIIGDGPLRSECEALISEFNLEDKVFLLGTCHNARNILSATNIFTLFSKWEGLPLSIIEAMYAGKPVISNDVGGISELITHEINGFLINDFDINKTADYLEVLLKDNTLLKDMGLLNMSKGKERFSLDKMVKEYDNLYKSIVNERVTSDKYLLGSE